MPLTKLIIQKTVHFVSFSDGKIPGTWQTTAWVIDNTLGYDDIYSLKATAVDVAVVTNKTFNASINFMEFYLYGSASFYVDGTKEKECVANSGWTKFGFYLSEGSQPLKTKAQVFNGIMAVILLPELQVQALVLEKVTQQQ